MRPCVFPATRVMAIAIAVTLLAGCTTFSKDGGFGTVSSAASKRLGKDAVLIKTGDDRSAIAKRTQELLSAPLGMDDAVQIALLKNRGLQASYGELGMPKRTTFRRGACRIPASRRVSAR